MPGFQNQNIPGNYQILRYDLSAPTSRVLRDGEEKVITKNLVVPGDILILETGDLVNAYMRLMKTSSIQIQESSLTGES
ncbi:MAG: hypothetical protein KMY54_04025, partial [Erysipelothrix sp.]|nr:hypothetical protein [Erysipelothrix sp.]